MNDAVVSIFQNCLNLPELAHASDSEPFHDGNRFIHIKVEEGADMQEDMEVGEDPLAVTCPVVKTENEVSFMSVCLLLRGISVFRNEKQRQCPRLLRLLYGGKGEV
jgi:hypothetical protein